MPTVLATDDFNRGDGGLGSNWTDSIGDILDIDTQEVTGTVNESSASEFYNAVLPDNDMYCQVAVPTALKYGGATARADANDWVCMEQASDPGYWDIVWYNAGAWTSIGSDYEVAPVDDEVARIEVVGTECTGYIDMVQRIQGSNAGIPSSGRGGLYAYSFTPRFDDWEVGNMADEEGGGLSSRRASNRGILRGVSRGIG